MAWAAWPHADPSVALWAQRQWQRPESGCGEVRQDVEVSTLTLMVTICHGMGTQIKHTSLFSGYSWGIFWAFVSVSPKYKSSSCVGSEWDITLFRPDFSPSSVCFICGGHGRGWWLGYAGYAGVCTKLNYIFAPVKHALHAQSGSRVPDGCWPLHSGKIWCGYLEIILCTPWSNVHNKICIYKHVLVLVLFFWYPLNHGF